MALSEFEIAIGGITSIPVVGGLIFLGYKSFGEKFLDTSKLKPKKNPVVKKEAPAAEVKKEAPASEKKISASKTENSETSNNPPDTTQEETSPSELPAIVSEEASTPSKEPPEDKSKASKPNSKT